MDGTKPAERPRGARHGARVVLAVALLALLAAAFGGRRSGDAFFTGLDDSAYTLLATAEARGFPMAFHDETFSAVPPDVRQDLLYRPDMPRKTRDRSHWIRFETLDAVPYFQPFLPWQRAHLPGLAPVLGLLAFLLAAFHSLAGAGWRGPSSPPAALQLALLAIAAPLLVPWIPRFACGPYADGMATVFAAFALSLSFVSSRAGAGIGAVSGLCLGLATTFHPPLAAFAVPIALFGILRRGSWRYTLALAAGSAAGLAPLVWSTLFFVAPYGNFLDPAVLRAMIAGSPDIRALAFGLAAAVPVGAVIVLFAHVPRFRAFAARGNVRTAIAVACVVVVAAAVSAVRAIPAAHRAFGFDRDGILPSLLPLVAAAAMAFRSRRGATCALLAGCALASVPFFVIQGQEVPVGLWSLRRSLPPFALTALAAFLGAFEIAAEEAGDRTLFRRRALRRRAWVLLAAACAVAQSARIPLGALRGGERGGAALLAAIDAKLEPGAICLFDYFPFAAPSAALDPRRAVFGLAEGVGRRLGHGRALAWLRSECTNRPVLAVASVPVAETVLEDGVALVPEGAPANGTLAMFDGPTFRTSAPRSHAVSLTFLRVRPAAPGDGTALAVSHSPFGLVAPWDVPRGGKPGRWARQGSGFWGPVPEPGKAVEFEIEAGWTPPPGVDWPAQTLRVQPPWPSGPVEFCVPAGAGRATLRARFERSADDSEDRGAVGVWRLSTSRAYDPAAHGIGGYPPDLVVPVYRLRAVPVP